MANPEAKFPKTRKCKFFSTTLNFFFPSVCPLLLAMSDTRFHCDCLLEALTTAYVIKILGWKFFREQSSFKVFRASRAGHVLYGTPLSPATQVHLMKEQVKAARESLKAQLLKQSF